MAALSELHACIDAMEWTDCNMLLAPSTSGRPFCNCQGRLSLAWRETAALHRLLFYARGCHSDPKVLCFCSCGFQSRTTRRVWLSLRSSGNSSAESVCQGGVPLRETSGHHRRPCSLDGPRICTFSSQWDIWIRANSRGSERSFSVQGRLCSDRLTDQRMDFGFSYGHY